MAKKTDPIYGYEVDTLEADHIMPLKEITEQSGFDQLSFEDQKAIANLEENFMGLGKQMHLKVLNLSVLVGTFKVRSNLRRSTTVFKSKR